ncbi:MAG TPA: hypothetical protein VEI07_18620 [Planctomycetaceae bacterium]|nr:hypothetical protein [Planctomycetaceae bacterium]
MTEEIPIEQFDAWLVGFVQSIETLAASPVFEEPLDGFMQSIAGGFESSQSPFGAGLARPKGERPKGHNLVPNQHGTGRIPARPFSGINDEQAQRAVNLLRENLIKTLGSHAAP